MAQAQPHQDPVSPIRPLLAGTLRESTRIDLEREVALSFQDLEGFLTEFSVNISTTGMFVRTQDPRPAGTLLGFALSLSDGQALIRGHGEVVWVRRYDEGSNRPAGMGIRFLNLDAESRRLIRWVIVRRCFKTDQKLDLSEMQAAAGRPLTPDGDGCGDLASSELRRLYSFAGCASARPERRFGLRPFLTLAALCVCCLYLFPGTTQSSAVTAVVAGTAVPEPGASAEAGPAAGLPAEAAPALAAAATPAAATPAPPIEAAGGTARQLAEVARRWARA